MRTSFCFPTWTRSGRRVAGFSSPSSATSRPLLLSSFAMESGNGAAVPPQVRASPSAEKLRRISNGRAEIDFSAPFGSVREAVVRFGGSAPAAARWRPAQMTNLHFSPAEIELMKVEEQKVKIEMDLYVKEKETFNVLKELEMTKRIAEGLNLQLQKHTSQFGENQGVQSYTTGLHPNPLAEQKCPIYSKTCASVVNQNEVKSQSPGLILLELKQAKANLNTTTNGLAGFRSNIELLKSCPVYSETHLSAACQSEGKSQSPGLILMELKQAKTNLNTTTTGLAGFRTNIELLKSKISEEKALLEKTREKVRSNAAKITSLEEELGRETLRLSVVKNTGSGTSPDTLSQIRLLNFEKEKYTKMVEALKLEVCELIADIEQAKCKTKAAEVRWIAAKRMEAASRSAEAVALAEIKTLIVGKKINPVQTAATVELSIMEHAMLVRRSQGVDDTSRKKLESAMMELKEAQQSKLEALEKVEEATTDVETSRKVLEEALKREEEANKGRNAAEEALRKLKPQRSNRTWSSENISKFKNYSAASHRRPTRILDVNGLSLVTVGSSSSMGPTLSIGQILSRKLIDSEDYKTRAIQRIGAKPRVSLRQILSKNHDIFSSPSIDDGGARKQFSIRRKKFGFVALAFLLARQSRKKQAAT